MTLVPKIENAPTGSVENQSIMMDFTDLAGGNQIKTEQVTLFSINPNQAANENIVVGNEEQEEILKLQLELKKAKEQISERAGQLTQANEIIARQKEQLLHAVKFVVDHQKHVAQSEEQARKTDEITTKLLNQAINDLQVEKSLRNLAESKVENLKTVLTKSDEVVSNILSEMKESVNVSNPWITPFTVVTIQNPLELYSSVFKESLGGLSKRLTETRRDLAYRNSMLKQLETALMMLPVQQNDSSSNALSPTTQESTIMDTSSALSPLNRVTKDTRENHHLEKMTNQKEKENQCNCSSISDRYERKCVSLAQDEKQQSVSMAGNASLSSPLMSDVSAQSNMNECNTLTSSEDNGHATSFNEQCRVESAVTHEVDVTDPTGRRCVCGKKSVSKFALNSHIHRFITAPKFCCAKCDKSYVFGSELRQHYKTTHKIVWNFSSGCRLCGESFKNRGALMLHHKAVHSEIFGVPSNLGINHPPTLDQETIKQIGMRPSLNIQKKQDTTEIGTKSQMERHGRDSSTRKDQFYCVCGRKFNFYSALYSHISSKSNPRVFKCNLCPKAYNINSQLKAHYLRSHKRKHSSQKYGCVDCGQTFSELAQLKSHRKLSHNMDHNHSISLQENENSTSAYSSAILQQLPDSVNTIATLSTRVLRKRKRSDSDQTYTRSRLEYPLRRSCFRQIDSNTNRMMTDQLVKDTSPLASASKKTVKHEVKMHLSDPNSFQCTCGKAFCDKYALLKHIRIHNPKFHCNRCTKSYFFACRLKSHYLSAHKMVGKGSFGCTICGEIVGKQWELTLHNDTKHLLKPNSLNGNSNLPGITRPASLDQHNGNKRIKLTNDSATPSDQEIENLGADQSANKIGTTTEVFEQPTTKETNNNHQRTWNVLEGKFGCTCGQMFKSFNHLSIHIQTKTNPGVFKCNLCFSSFIYEGSLKMHMLSKHKIVHRD